MYNGTLSGNHMLVLTYSCLIGFKMYSIWGKPSLVWETEPASPGLVRTYLEEPTIATFLDQNNSLLHSRSYPQIRSAKKPLCTASGDCHRKPHLDSRQRPTDCGQFSPSGYISIIAQILFKDHHGRGAIKITRANTWLVDTKNSGVQSLSQKCQNKLEH